MKLYIVQYRGIGMVSRILKWKTWSIWSHSGMLFHFDALGNVNGNDWVLAEAWEKVGVDLVEGKTMQEVLSKNHHVGTPVDIFETPCSSTQVADIYGFAKAHEGENYDWKGIVGFIARKPFEESGKWFCSEYAHAACKHGELLLQREASYKVNPNHIGISPVIDPYSHLITEDYDRLCSHKIS